MVPVRDPGQDAAVELGEGVGPGAGLLGSVRRQRLEQLAGPDTREHRQLRHPLEEAGDPLDRLVPEPSPLLG